MKRPLYENNGFMGKKRKKIVKTLWFLLDILGGVMYSTKSPSGAKNKWGVGVTEDISHILNTRKVRKSLEIDLKNAKLLQLLLDVG